MWLLHVNPKNSRLKKLLYSWSHKSEKFRDMTGILIERLSVNILAIEENEMGRALVEWLLGREKDVRVFKAVEYHINRFEPDPYVDKLMPVPPRN